MSVELMESWLKCCENSKKRPAVNVGGALELLL